MMPFLQPILHEFRLNNKESHKKVFSDCKILMYHLMDKKSTPDNVLRYIYKETSFSENIALRQEISENWQLQEQYIELRNTAKTLEKLPLRSPSESSINIILGYSQHANRELEHLL